MALMQERLTRRKRALKMISSYTAADALAVELARNGVDTVFCITGAGNLAIVDALSRHGGFRLVYSHHEQAAVMEAQGYSRITGGLGVALVTTGGGTSNALTGLLSAHLDSIPVLLISGNESSFHCQNMQDFRAYGVQGFDSVSVLHPVCKSSVRVMESTECAATVSRAIDIALTPRTGPVHVDVPMDLQRRQIPSQSPLVSVRARPATLLDTATETTLVKLAVQLQQSNRPLLYIGNGVRGSSSTDALLAFIEQNRLPYALSWSAIDLLHADSTLDIGRLGIYGDRAANILLQQADLLVCIGTRLAIPQTGYDQADFGRNAERWVLDVDPVELTKFNGPRWNTLEIEAAAAVRYLLDSAPLKDLSPRQDWLQRIAFVKSELPRESQAGEELCVPDGYVHSQQVIEYLNEALDDDAVVVTDVGAGLLTGHYAFRPRPGQRFFTSQGLGEMGFGLPGAIGASFAAGTRQLVCLNTDGAMMFNLQELEVARCHSIPLKLFIFNNDGYAMIKISQRNLFDGRLAGSTIETGLSFPDFEQVAMTFGFGFTRIHSRDDLLVAATAALSTTRAELIEVIMSPEQRYMPRLATLRLPNGDLVSPPLEDLDPLIPLEQLSLLLGYEPTAASRRARGFDA